ncbi:MAG: Rne/Rng family ribonuclease [Acidobacteria bacterium]|nr:Rne/Rng family ribonuclease [Acidobacteriota bacterium]
MAKELVISTSPHETKIALLEDGQVIEVSVEREKETGLVGSIYKGRVTRVLPGMQSAFINIGLERDAFLYISDFFEDRQEYERILTSAEEGTPPAAEESPASVAAEAIAQAEAGPEAQADATPEASRAAEPPAQPEATPPPAPPSPQTRAPQEPRLPRRLGRRSQRARYRGRRGGRGRSRGRFSPRGPAPAPPSEPDAHEPVILPGESLAKYRDRIAPPQREATTPDSQPTKSAPATHKPPSPYETQEVVSPWAEETRAPEATADSIMISTDAEVTITPVRETTPPRDTASGFKRSDHRAAARRKQETDYIQVAEVDTGGSPNPEIAAAAPSEPQPGPPGVTSAPVEEVEAPMDFGHREVRVGEENGPVALPPSVRERTAGGVEWERPSRGGRRRVRRRPERRGPRPRPAPGPRPKITELIQPGQELIVQIAKEQIGTKGARITSHVTLPGRYLVYMPTIEHVGVSRRIRSDQARARLRRLLLELKGSLGGGIVVRTAAESTSDEDIRRDLDYLVTLWRDLVQRAEHTPAPVLLHRDLGLMERILRDQLTGDFESIWIDNEEEYAKAVEFVNQFQPSLAPRIKLYTRDLPVFEAMGIQAEIDQALRPKVWLKTGGYIVINHTEALVAIDVNTGKFVGKGSTRLEDTIVRTNLDAVKEIVRQIRLRDLGGIIIIDFIDMEDPRNRRKVMQELERALRADRAPSKTLAFNEFGLIAITRKRVRQSLEKVLCQPCPYCTGTGMVKSVTTLCNEIQAEANKMARTIDAPELTIRAHPEIAKALKARESGLLRELEEQTGKNIIVQADQSLHFIQYTIF